MSMYNIGYVDEDSLEAEKFARKLRDSFNVTTYQIVKGTSKEDLVKQIYESEIDLLMVDYLMCDKGFLTYNGDEIVRDFEKIKPKFPMIIFTNREDDAFPSVDNPNIIYDKNLLTDRKEYFVQMLTKNIELYKTYIREKKEIIGQLIIKSVSEDLNSQEKHLLLESQLDLRSLDKLAVEVPNQLLDNNKIDSLAKTTKEAEVFLESLIDKYKSKS